MGSVAVHVSEAIGDAPVAKQERDLVGRLGTEGEEVPEHVHVLVQGKGTKKIYPHCQTVCRVSYWGGGPGNPAHFWQAKMAAESGPPPVHFWQAKMAAESGPPSPLLAGKDGRQKRTPSPLLAGKDGRRSGPPSPL